MPWVFNMPPNWPSQGAGWTPPPDWQSDPAWGPAPDDWQFWVEANVSTSPTPRAPAPTAAPIAPVGARPSEKVSIFNAKQKARSALEDVERLQRVVEDLQGLDLLEVRQRTDAEREALTQFESDAAQAKTRIETEIEERERQLEELERTVARTQEADILQDVGIYDYRHPAQDSVEYKAKLAAVLDRKKVTARNLPGEVASRSNWTVNSSLPKGRAMVREVMTLMLRAFNAEADNLVRTMRPYKCDSSVDRLRKTADHIAKVGKTFGIAIPDPYVRLCVEELELTADYLAKVVEEKERVREERAQAREEAKVQEELEAERSRIEKERQHYENLLATLTAQGNAERAAEARNRLDELDKALVEVDYRAANIRAGYVYVISNVGSFGSDVVKIGLTRRLDPMDRVRELGDASVPFNFDVHALHFSADAVGIEASMHQRFAPQRLNLVNLRREFFRTTPSEAREALLEFSGDLLEFTEDAEAAEFHQSENSRFPGPS